MKCKNTGDPCDPESYYCHKLGYTSKSIQNKTCERLIGAEEAEEEYKGFRLPPGKVLGIKDLEAEG